MNVAEFSRWLSERVIRWAPTDFNQRSRQLKKVGLLDKGPHGRHAPHITPEVATVFLISMAPDSPRLIGPLTGLYMIMGPVKPPKDSLFVDFNSFSDALTFILGSARREIQSVTICRSWEEASIVYRAGNEVLEQKYGPINEKGEAELNPKANVRVDLTFEGEFLKRIATLIIAAEQAESHDWTHPDVLEPLAEEDRRLAEEKDSD